MNVVRRLRSLSQLDQTFEPSPSGKHGSRPGSLTDWPSRRAWTHIKRYKLAAAPWGLPTLVAVPESDFHSPKPAVMGWPAPFPRHRIDRKSKRLNSSH